MNLLRLPPLYQCDEECKTFKRVYIYIYVQYSGIYLYFPFAKKQSCINVHLRSIGEWILAYQVVKTQREKMNKTERENTRCKCLPCTSPSAWPSWSPSPRSSSWWRRGGRDVAWFGLVYLEVHVKSHGSFFTNSWIKERLVQHSCLLSPWKTEIRSPGLAQLWDPEHLLAGRWSWHGKPTSFPVDRDTFPGFFVSPEILCHQQPSFEKDSLVSTFLYF